MFVLDRIKMLKVTDERFSLPKDFDLDDLKDERASKLSPTYSAFRLSNQFSSGGVMLRSRAIFNKS